MRRWLLAVSSLSLAIACGLNPQPLPPEDTAAGTDASISDSASPIPKGDGGGNADGAASDASDDVNVSDGSVSDGGDASRDADTDGG